MSGIEQVNRRGLLIILSSPSGAGKSTLARKLMGWDPSIRFSVSATTRAPRPGEVDRREYYFKSRESFESLVSSGDMLEHAEVFGNLYGSPKGPVEAAMREARADIAVLSFAYVLDLSGDAPRLFHVRRAAASGSAPTFHDRFGAPAYATLMLTRRLFDEGARFADPGCVHGRIGE